MGSQKSQFRRVEIRKGRPDSYAAAWGVFRDRGGPAAVAVALAFCALITSILLLRQQVVPYRPGQYIAHDLNARVDFKFFDKARYDQAKEDARQREPRVYTATGADVWRELQDRLLGLPDAIHEQKLDHLDAPYNQILDSAALSALEHDRTGPARARYEENVRQFVAYAKEHLLIDNGPLVILPAEQRDADLGRTVVLSPAPGDTAEGRVKVDFQTYGTRLPDSVIARLEDYAKAFEVSLGTKIARLAADRLSRTPNYALDPAATALAKNAAGDRPTLEAVAEQVYPRNMVIVPQSILSDRDFLILKAENEAYYRSLAKPWEMRLGIAMIGVLLTVALSAYVWRYQPRVTRNTARGVALVALMVSMLLLSLLAGIGSSSLYVFGTGPTILAAIILTIAYDQRFACGVGTIHAILVTAALNQGLDFFLVIWTGVLTSCFLLDDIRTRSKLIEVGGLAALAMMFVAAAAGATEMNVPRFVAFNCLYVGAAGLASGFVVLGILPFVERAFRITTSMTLLELADVSQPLLRRLAVEAPGTYNHSLQVATLAEAAGESIGANSLACRVGAYYHDIGKINKPDYFVENQMGGPNRHLNLTPTLSLRIIIGHVKDGVEMAKEYGLPASFLPFIQQHHGTTLVEYFYRQACESHRQAGTPQIADSEFRYPGPKPKSKETAIVMICDAVESAVRAAPEPTASRIEEIVHQMALKRLLDGQFDDCDLTMKELAKIEKSLVKMLLGIYHGRIAYPPAVEAQPEPRGTSAGNVRTA